MLRKMIDVNYQVSLFLLHSETIRREKEKVWTKLAILKEVSIRLANSLKFQFL